MNALGVKKLAAAGAAWLALCCSAWGAFGQAAPEKGKEVPLHITAMHLEADQAKRLITFGGQVKAQYGDSFLYTDQLRVYYEAPKPGKAPAAPEEAAAGQSPLGDLGGEKIERIEAEGHVRFVQEDKVATGQKAIYYRDEEKVVLLGNPQVWRGENNLKGEKITLHLKDNRVVVESSVQQRVEAHLYQAPGQGAKVGGILPASRPKSANSQEKQKRP
ncbi:MAG: LptA/OstA family protein [Deltaproteobacteria bacterium]|nr:LptA/OstA family protein [Deltaproteobacteria bacterium]